MPIQVRWEPAFSVGDEEIDAQHRRLLEQCEVLGRHAAGEPDAAARAAFDAAFDEFKRLVRGHFETEAARLAARGCPGLDAHRDEREDFEALVAEVATTEHFDPLELQHFFANWCFGHVASAVGSYGPWLAPGPAPR